MLSGYIDLSKRRVSAEEVVKCEEKFAKAKAVSFNFAAHLFLPFIVNCKCGTSLIWILVKLVAVMGMLIVAFRLTQCSRLYRCFLFTTADFACLLRHYVILLTSTTGSCNHVFPGICLSDSANRITRIFLKWFSQNLVVLWTTVMGSID